MPKAHKKRRPLVVKTGTGQTHIQGMPRVVLSDLYYFLMKRSWVFVFAIIIITYLLANAVFGALYMLDPTGIANADPASFLDHFFFSIQTGSTIGYGYMYPKSNFVNLIITLESIVAMIGVAMVTGLVFAKFSRPRARVMFSSSAVVTRHDGALMLMFRVANERANHIADVSLTASLIRTGVTTEGSPFRRITDLSMVRHRSPVFFLTWTVMHRIDESSPLHGMNAEQLAAMDGLIVCSLIGHDSTMGQTIHARHTYTADHIVWKRRLADIMSTDSGNSEIALIDYHNFHTTEPESP